MPHFEVKSPIEINCGIEKAYCDRYPKECSTCIADRLKDLGLEIEQNPKILELDSKNKQIEIEADASFQKLIDLRNIKQIIIIINGMEIFNQHVSGSEIDINLLTGFIQANLSFSESEEEDKSESNFYAIDLGHNYEFQYKDFNVFLRKVKTLNVCLVLEKKASPPLKKLTEIFADEIKKTYRDDINDFIDTGRRKFDGLKESVLKAYSVNILSPMVISRSISLDLLKDKRKKRILDPIFNEINDTLSKEPYFYVNGLLAKVKAILNFDQRFIFHEILQLIDEGLIIPTTLEKIENKIVISEEMRINTFSRCSSTLSESLLKSEEVEGLIDKLDTMDKNTAETLMDEFIASGKAASIHSFINFSAESLSIVSASFFSCSKSTICFYSFRIL